ncbi:diacylglycerol kinase family protein [Kitasatospora sp. NBC_00240]|uniref:diacylglycerol/lipid kinase family protein n=1 Tax=Kitasatospora sp. NBC_00240 TaxID=2903567 RepID=UPI0022547BDB|nr:diacylglycerol kinase family protein [Kitasatospora sp. NBC_00240]MCX5215128.1 diacylglycerol kinase family protein [Kitasatospora sp. NBC_00240]
MTDVEPPARNGAERPGAGTPGAPTPGAPTPAASTVATSTAGSAGAAAPPVTAAQRWLARLACAAALGVVVLLLLGGLTSLAVLLVGVLGLAATLAALWWFLSNRGPLRWACAVVAVAVPVAVTVYYVVRHQLWVIVLVLVLAATAAAAARAALVRGRPRTAMPEVRTPPPARPFLIMNPRSGGGKVGRFALDTKARSLGAEVALLEGPGQVDVAALARTAATGGADLLGVAGGDGTQALVAGIAAEFGLPFLVVSAGTRNHFAMDLGLDRERPDAGLDALDDGVEIRLDLGLIGGRTFVNNASFGAYAGVVQSPAYRDDKTGTILQLLPEMLSGRQGARLVVRIDGGPAIEDPKALLVSNNPYGSGDPAGLGRRTRLDTGRLGVIAITVDNAAQAAGLLRGRHAKGLSTFLAHEVVVESDAAEIPVGIDGEAVLMPTPVRLTIQPLALRVRVPRKRPGTPHRPAVDRTVLLRQAFSSGSPAASSAPRRGRHR